MPDDLPSLGSEYGPVLPSVPHGYPESSVTGPKWENKDRFSEAEKEK